MKPWKIQVVDRRNDFFLVLGEVLFDSRAHVERFERNPILLLEICEEICRPILGETSETAIITIHTTAELEYKNHRDWRIARSEVCNLLRYPVFIDTKIVFFQARNYVAV